MGTVFLCRICGQWLIQKIDEGGTQPSAVGQGHFCPQQGGCGDLQKTLMTLLCVVAILIASSPTPNQHGYALIICCKRFVAFDNGCVNG